MSFPGNNTAPITKCQFISLLGIIHFTLSHHMAGLAILVKNGIAHL